MVNRKVVFSMVIGFLSCFVYCVPWQAVTTPEHPLRVNPADFNQPQAKFILRQLEQIALSKNPRQPEIIATRYSFATMRFTQSVRDDYVISGELKAKTPKGHTKIVLIFKWDEQENIYLEVFRWVGWNKEFDANVKIIDLNESDGIQELAIESDRSGGQSVELVVTIYKYMEGRSDPVWSATLEQAMGGCWYKEYHNRYTLRDMGAVFKDIELEINYKEFDQEAPGNKVKKELKHVNLYYWNGVKYVPRGHEFSYRYKMLGPDPCKDLP